jgi:hypothetical protein
LLDVFCVCVRVCVCVCVCVCVFVAMDYACDWVRTNMEGNIPATVCYRCASSIVLLVPLWCVLSDWTLGAAAYPPRS